MNLRDLSKNLGLSQTTVSRALNGYPEVNETTRVKVMEAAAKFDYRPNSRAKSLATGRAMAIGHVIAISSQSEMVNVVFSDFIAGAGEVYADNGYNMVMSVVRDEMSAYAELARQNAVDGVIVHSPVPNDPRIALLNELKMPFVVHGRSSDVDTPYCWMDVDNKSALTKATKHLLDLGHRRIALVNGDERMTFALRRRQGFLDALAEYGVTPDEALMWSHEMTEPSGYAATNAALDLACPATAVITSSIISALGVRRALHDRGLEMGRDVSVICFDDEISYLPNGDETPIFTAAHSSVRAAGRCCAELLIARIKDPEAAPSHELWNVDLVVGPSTGPVP